MLQTADNQVDLFYGFDAGNKYGFDLVYASGKDETRSGKDSGIALKSGVIGSNWDAHVNVSLDSKSNATDIITPLGVGALSDTVAQEFKGKLGLQFGGSYNVGAHSKVFGYYKHFDWDQTDSYTKYTAFHTAASGLPAALKAAFENAGQSGTIKGNFSSYYLGWGDQVPVNNGDDIFVSLSAKKTDINVEFANKTEIKHLVIPLTIGYEAKATEWLTLRGSIVQNLYGQRDNKNESSVNPVAKGLVAAIYGTDGKATIANSTAVNAGATLTFGQLSIDGLVGTTGTTGTETSNTGVLSGSNLQTTVGMNYKF
jgi:hypothetical protein